VCVAVNCIDKKKNTQRQPKKCECIFNISNSSKNVFLTIKNYNNLSIRCKQKLKFKVHGRNQRIKLKTGIVEKNRPSHKLDKCSAQLRNN